MQSTTILICGAGPTGLMMAAQLCRFNVDFIIIDKKSGPTKESRAVVVQAKSMEIYEQLHLEEEVLTNADRTDGLCFWRKGRKVGEAILKDFGSDFTPFPFVIMYEQSLNETLLYTFLQRQGREVVWNTELIDCIKDGNRYAVTVRENNVDLPIAASFVVACDGARSKVRELTAMPFSGGTYEHVFYVADTHVKAGLCSNKINFFMSSDTFNLFFPMVGEKRYRAIGILPEKYYHRTEISFDEISQQVDLDAGLDLGFHDTQWYSTYKLHHKKVQAFNTENIFFCGDAAHVHSPVGGQGMNTGLQDAYNLAWKLALAAQGKANNNLLLTYHEERNPIAQKLLKTTDRLFLMVSKNSWLSILVRMYLMPAMLPLFMKIRKFRRNFFMLISQLNLGYEHSSLSKGTAGNIKAGIRFPYLLLSAGNTTISSFHLIRENQATPFLIIIYNLLPVNSLPTQLCTTITIEDNSHNQLALRKAGFSSSFICLLRPDNYIGYISQYANQQELTEYLQRLIT